MQACKSHLAKLLVQVNLLGQLLRLGFQAAVQSPATRCQRPAASTPTPTRAKPEACTEAYRVRHRPRGKSNRGRYQICRPLTSRTIDAVGTRWRRKSLSTLCTRTTLVILHRETSGEVGTTSPTPSRRVRACVLWRGLRARVVAGLRQLPRPARAISVVKQRDRPLRRLPRLHPHVLQHLAHEVRRLRQETGVSKAKPRARMSDAW
jgi:hypothetical protein